MELSPNPVKDTQEIIVIKEYEPTFNNLWYVKEKYKSFSDIPFTANFIVQIYKISTILFS